MLSMVGKPHLIRYHTHKWQSRIPKPNALLTGLTATVETL